MFERTVKSFIKRLAFLVVLSAFAVSSASTASAGSSSAPADSVSAQAGTGQLKICKRIERGSPLPPAGTLFDFSVTGPNMFMRQVTVAAGSCFAFQVAPGRYTVREEAETDYQVANIFFPAAPGFTSRDVTRARATADVVAGQTTEIVFVNEFANSILKICKDLAAGTTVADGTLFRFAVEGTHNVAVAPGQCVAVRVPAGVTTVRELVPADMRVLSIRFLVGSGTTDVARATADSNQVAGQTTVVEFVNQGFGFIQICKETRVNLQGQPGFPETGSDLTGTFRFTSPSFAGTVEVTVLPGADQPVCSDLIRVPAGVTSVTEAPQMGTFLAGTRTVPAANKIRQQGRTLIFNVPVGTPEDQVLAIFRNAKEAFIEICKETRNGLSGTFRFTLRPINLLQTYELTVQPGQTGVVCTRPIRVIARDIRIAEQGPGDLLLVRLEGNTTSTIVEGSFNQAAKSVVVNVRPGTVSNDTLVIFRNGDATVD